MVFHGPYGFGKTHLLNALGWEALRTAPDKKVVWRFNDHKTFKTIATVQVFGEGDAPLSGEGVH